jgi:hypothetical protein
VELIEKIKNILQTKSKLLSPLFDIYFDDTNQVVGYVADEVFEFKTDEESQELIWNSLKRYLEQKELINISGIFHETLQERTKRLSEYSQNTLQLNSQLKFWLHKTPEETKYWVFMDVEKINTEYKSFFLIINQLGKFHKNVVFTYTDEVLEFMELKDNEIYEELYSYVFHQAESEIKLDLMKKYDELKEKQHLMGKNNLYNYVFENFKLIPIAKNKLQFTAEEISILNKYLGGCEFSIKNSIEEAIRISKIINNSKIIS